MDNFALILLICLGALLFAIVGSYALTPGDHRPQPICGSDSKACMSR